MFLATVYPGTHGATVCLHSAVCLYSTVSLYSVWYFVRRLWYSVRQVGSVSLIIEIVDSVESFFPDSAESVVLIFFYSKRL